MQRNKPVTRSLKSVLLLLALVCILVNSQPSLSTGKGQGVWDGARQQNLVRLLRQPHSSVRGAYFQPGGGAGGGSLVLHPVSGADGVVLLARNGVRMKHLPPAFSARMMLGEDGRLSGTVGPVLLAGRIMRRNRLELVLIGDDGRVIREFWALDFLDRPKPTAVEALEVPGGTWIPVPIPESVPGGVRLTLRGGQKPQGYFAPKKTQFPGRPVEDEDNDVYLAKTDLLSPPATAPDFFNAQGLPVWVLPENRRQISGEPLLFWLMDGVDPQDVLHYEFGWRHTLPPFRLDCDPSVQIEVSPSVAAPGETVRITVTAAADAGIADYGWAISATPEPFGEGLAIPGEGESAVSFTWTRRYTTPGRYRFRGFASDTLARSDPDGVHTTRDACGDAFDDLDVIQARRSYRVAFVLLAPVGTDPTSGEVRSGLAKIAELKRQYVREFFKATDFTGVVDVSYPTVFLTPPGPIYGVFDGDPLLTNFTRRASREFYATQPDDFDFVVYYEMYPDKAPGSRHFTVRTAVAGLGVPRRDYSSSYGASGRLRGIGLITDVADLPDTYAYGSSRMRLLLHESMAHQWGVYSETMRTSGSHYRGVQSLDDAHTLLYARPWRQISPNLFRVDDYRDPDTGFFRYVFHPWTLYVAGLKRRDEVPDSVLQVTPDRLEPIGRAFVTTGTATVLELDAIIAAEGDRYDVR